MATADAKGQVIDPGPASTWEYVEREALKVSRNCIGAKLGGGFVLIAGMSNNYIFVGASITLDQHQLTLNP